MIVTIANERGCIEKSILARNLAALRAMDNRHVLLIDADPQQSSLAWCNQRSAAGIKPNVSARAISAKGLQPELENLIPRYHDIVIDTEGRDCLGSRSALVAARVAIIPVRPDQMDAEQEAKLIMRIDTARLFNPGLRVLFVIVGAKTDLTPHELAAARSAVARIPAATLARTVIHEQEVLHNACAVGLCAPEHTPAMTNASAEMTNLYREVFTH